MQLFRPAFAQHPLSFGRGPVRDNEQRPENPSEALGDLRLFIGTFVAGFLFVSILIG